MDESKDIQNISSALSIFEANIRVNPFGLNQAAHRIYRRLERVVAALYLITNHIAPLEPIRISIRTECVKMIERSLGLGVDMSAVGSTTVRDLKESIRLLISLVRMLTVARLLSMQNARVAIEALDDLGNFIDVSRSSPSSEQMSITKEDFLDIRRSGLMDIKDTSFIKDKRQIKDINRHLGNSGSSSQMSVREQHVLSVLTGAGEVGIRDIVSSLPEYSEKMIQRELASLVASGRVKKTGLKRWSRYSAVV